MFSPPFRIPISLSALIVSRMWQVLSPQSSYIGRCWTFTTQRQLIKPVFVLENSVPFSITQVWINNAVQFLILMIHFIEMEALLLLVVHHEMIPLL